MSTEIPSTSAPDVHRDLAGKRVLVMGLGSFGGGAGAARYLAELGAHVCVTDRRDAAAFGPTLRALDDLELEFVLGQHREQDFERAEWIVVNPAVTLSHPLLARARAAGARLTSETELFLQAVPARIAAITGTQGKSSTAHLLHSLLVANGFRAHLGGNFGGSLLPELPRLDADDLVVLELSSYQLEALSPIPPRARVEVVAVVNVLPDHLERHGTFEAYRIAKARILEILAPDGVAVLPAADEWLARLPVRERKVLFHARAASEGLFLRDDRFHLDDEDLGRVDELALPGDFQRGNALVALGMARLLGATAPGLSAAVPALRGLRHRLQELAPVRGRRVIDNAVSTTPDSTVSALRCAPVRTVLVLGGRKKDLALDELCRVACERQTRALAFGEAGPELARSLAAAGVPCEPWPTMEEALRRAFDPEVPGDVVLFSPACSSFDAFANFEGRALAFRALLETLR